jgi:hypothetical protein
MTPISLNKNIRKLGAREIRIPNFEISWAGGCPWNQGLCFGSEDGRIVNTEPARQDPFRVVDSGEAINGVAFINDLMSVSTRSEVAFLKVPQFGDGRPERAIFDGGAHGVVATSSGRFVAPLGPNGLLFMEPNPSEPAKRGTVEAAGKKFNFYKVASLGSTDRGDVLACAVRRDGIVSMVHSKLGESGTMSSVAFPGLDVIDVCSLGSTVFPFAAAALGIDRSLHLFRDIVNDRRALTLQFDGLEGVAYRVLIARGNVLMLTNQWLYSFVGLASRFLGGQQIDVPTTIRGLRLQAVDAFLAFDRSLLVIMPDSVISIEVDRFTASKGTDKKILPPTLLDQPWEVRSGYPLDERLAA